jgi:hypothetical protein
LSHRCLPPGYKRYIEITHDQWCGSITFWFRSGSADPCLWWLMDPDPAIFVIDLQDDNKTLIKKKKFFCLLGTFWRYICIIFQRQKKSKRSHKTVGNNVFLTIFAWWWKHPIRIRIHTLRLIDPDPDSGGPKTYGSGSVTLPNDPLLFSVAQWIFWMPSERLLRSTLHLKEREEGSLYSCTL